VFIVVSVYLVIHSVRKLLDTPSYCLRYPGSWYNVSVFYQEITLTVLIFALTSTATKIPRHYIRSHGVHTEFYGDPSVGSTVIGQGHTHRLVSFL